MDYFFTQQDLYWLDHLLPDSDRRKAEDKNKETTDENRNNTARNKVWIVKAYIVDVILNIGDQREQDDFSRNMQPELRVFRFTVEESSFAEVLVICLHQYIQ